MNYSAILGILVTLTILLWAILLGGPLMIFFDITSVFFLLGGTLMLTLAVHGLAGWSALVAGIRRLLLPASTAEADWGQLRCQKVSQVAQTAGNIAIIMAGCGAMIGLTQMLANLDDPTKIGPAMAVCLLSTFYAIVMNLFLFIPLSRLFNEAAIDAG